jgi:hypothetical protein
VRTLGVAVVQAELTPPVSLRHFVCLPARKASTLMLYWKLSFSARRPNFIASACIRRQSGRITLRYAFYTPRPSLSSEHDTISGAVTAKIGAQLIE